MVVDDGRQLAERSAIRKVTLRLIPFLFILYFGAYLDRMNLSFAKATFVKDLGFSDTVYGLGSGIFFIGYFLFEVPSNIVLEKTGARVWIARIMITWGIISSAMLLIRYAPPGTYTAWFYTLRFLLGVAEAGFFPGMILYLSYWFPAKERARAIASFMTATPLSGVIGAALSSFLMTMMPRLAAGWGPTFSHFAGWQWVFLIEGIPSFILGFVVLGYLTDRPEQAKWLTDPERTALTDRMNEERKRTQQKGHFTLGQALAHPQVILLTVIYFALQIGFYGYNMWLPAILSEYKELGQNTAILLTMIPYGSAAIGMVWVARHSDRTGERRMSVVACCAVSAVGMAIAAFMHSPATALIFLSIAAIGLWGTLGPFWALPSNFLTGAAAAGGIAFINSIGNLGGFVGPYTMGALKDRTHSFTVGLLTLAGAILLAGILSLALHREKEAPGEVAISPVPGPAV